MKTTIVMGASIAATQLSEMFNEKFKTQINVTCEIKEGTPFVTIDFGNTPVNKVIIFSYELGRVQQLLHRKDEIYLIPGQYQLPDYELD